MDVIVERVAGLDIGKADLKACVRVPATSGRRRFEQDTRTFSSMTRQLQALAAWLRDCRVSLVVMEATGDFWKPVFYLLEEQFTVWLVNARDVKKVPGRKTDVRDAEWLAQLAQHGLISPCFVPPPDIRRLRDLTRQRANLVRERVRVLNRIEKILEDAGIKLSVVLSRTTTQSGRLMIEALISGERDPLVLADLALGKARARLVGLREALTGRFDEHHAFLARRALDHLDRLNAEVDTFTARIEQATLGLKRQRELLVTIPGVSHRVAEVILAETGGDMTRFPTPAALASWAGVAPGNNSSAGRNLGGTTTHGDTWLLAALGDAAAAAARTKNSYLSVYYKRMAKRRGSGRALVAVMHKILNSVWHMLTDDVSYRDLGADYFLRRPDQAERRKAKLLRELAELGVDTRNLATA